MFGTEQFSSTTAQVLPTLLAAMAVKGGLLLQRRPERLYRDVRQVAHLEVPGRTILRKLANIPYMTTIATLCVAFIIGEVTALTILFRKGPDRLSAPAAFVVWFSPHHARQNGRDPRRALRGPGAAGGGRPLPTRVRARGPAARAGRRRPPATLPG